jgi:hypothetical protein
MYFARSDKPNVPRLPRPLWKMPCRKGQIDTNIQGLKQREAVAVSLRDARHTTSSLQGLRPHICSHVKLLDRIRCIGRNGCAGSDIPQSRLSHWPKSARSSSRTSDDTDFGQSSSCTFCYLLKILISEVPSDATREAISSTPKVGSRVRVSH